MQELLTDFINYTRIVQSNEEAQTVNLEKVIDDVRKDFKEPIDNKKAIIKVDNLPEIIGYNYQLHLLFSNLLDNALKFSKADTPPTINITVTDVVSAETNDERKYIRISFIDNGIGFEKEFAEKIFMIFQRLHTSDSSYLGKGIGLAICKRVMVNHGGYITATAEPGVGATFNLYFLKEPGLINGSVS
jgi:signal transduction histidine kinase